MKTHLTLSFAFLAFLLVLTNCQKDEIQAARQTENLSLEEFDYFNREVPAHLKKERMWIYNEELANRQAALGRLLFYDPMLSKNNLISCATCHQQPKAFSDNLQFSTGLFGEQTTRNSMALVNLGFQRRFFWDFSGDGLEQEVMKPIQNHIEMGIENLEQLTQKLQQSTSYPPLFEEVFGRAEITEQNLSTAIATFVKSIYCYDSKYDKGVTTEFANFTRSEANGMALFFGKAGCEGCHNEPHFTSSWTANIGLDLEYKDRGARNGNFKIPSLRNIELTAPYMHDGRFSTLEEVVNHYDHGVKNHNDLNGYLLDRSMIPYKPKRLNLSDHEKQDLIAFLKTLTDENMLRAERFSDPF
ncbi:MAG: cytochrome c peroxidase [Bacteroidota bacterium]